MSNSGKMAVWIVAFGISLTMLATDHRGVQTGEYLFQLLRLPVTSGEDGLGLNYVVVAGIILLVASGYGLHRQLKLRFKRPGRKMVLASIGYLLIFPSLAYWLLLAFHWNTSGLAAADYSGKSTCNMQTSEDIVTYSCKLMLMNYSREAQQVAIKPIVDNYEDHAVEIVEKTIQLQSRSHSTYYLEFKSKPVEFSISGHSVRTGIQFRQGDEIKEIKWY